MKKLYLLTLLPLVLTACPKHTHELKVKVLCPTGAPSIAFYNYSTDTNFETNNEVANIAKQITSSSPYDVIVIDTTNGLNAIKGGANFKMAATITLGNFYIASTGKDDNDTLDKDDVVVLFGNEAAIPYKIFTYLYGTDYNVEFCGGKVDKAANVLETGKNTATGHEAEWVFVAEPYLYGAKNNETSIIYNKDYPVIDVQAIYKQKSGGLPLMQASVFVKDTANKENVDELLSSLKSDINKGIENPSLIKEGLDRIDDPHISETKFGRPSNEIEAIMKYNGLGLGYLSAKENKDLIDTYISLFNMEKTDEKIYY